MDQGPRLRGQHGHGRLRQVEEIVHLSDTGQVTPNPNVWLTQYSYDTLDNFLGYTDSQGNQKYFRYDALSRKTFMNDPDRGIMQWHYDPASNVTNTIDAKGQQIVYTYDGVNRLQTENYLDGNPKPPWRGTGSSGLAAANSVAYHYDFPHPNVDNGDQTTSTAMNTFGKLAWVEDLSGEEHTSYDARGRVAYTIKRLPDLQFLYATDAGLGQPLVSYRTDFAYDSLDRMTSLIYPDGDSIGYTYNQRNLLQSIQGGVNGLTRAGAVIENIAYQASAQLGSIQYGNGILTQYGYDPRLRLTSITTAPEATPAAPLIAFAYLFDDASNIKTIYDNRPTSVVPAGNPRRNTQVFGYDDLYRITSAGYAFGAPGDITINGGSIAYNYDRIGNMLAQTSTINDSDPLTGLPVANLGQMRSGGSAGTANRIGRAPGDPPGPHALTSITQATNSPVRTYPYDANGNMTVIDGLTNTWDFKDRLVGVQSAQMSAQYLYDYTDRRVGKNVAYAPGSTNSSLTTLYINKYFEVRENDQPTKFVWNGDTRVARVIGSLSSNPRIQRLRLWPGMNLVSVAVNAALPPSIANIGAAFQWAPSSLSWQTASPGATLSAGTVLWIQSATNSTLPFTGSYTGPIPYTVANGPNFLPSAGLEALTLTNLPLQLATDDWCYDAQHQVWQLSLTSPAWMVNSLPLELPPGKALMLRANAFAQMVTPDPRLRIEYYHQDHLGSTAVCTLASGAVASETTYFPFGQVRTQFSYSPLIDVYEFLNKETDPESSAIYCEARYLRGNLGRFCSVDSASLQTTALLPRQMDPYSYAVSSPVALKDMDGRDPQASSSNPPQNSQAQVRLADGIVHYLNKRIAALQIQIKVKEDLIWYVNNNRSDIWQQQISEQQARLAPLKEETLKEVSDTSGSEIAKAISEVAKAVTGATTKSIPILETLKTLSEGKTQLDRATKFVEVTKTRTLDAYLQAAKAAEAQLPADRAQLQSLQNMRQNAINARDAIPQRRLP